VCHEGHIHSLRQRHGIQDGRALPNNYAIANESEEELSSPQDRIQRLHEHHLHQTDLPATLQHDQDTEIFRESCAATFSVFHALSSSAINDEFSGYSAVRTTTTTTTATWLVFRHPDDYGR